MSAKIAPVAEPMSLSYATLKNRLDQIAARKQQAEREAPAQPAAPAPSPLLDALRGAELLIGPQGRAVLQRATLRPEAPRLPAATEPFCPDALAAFCADSEGLDPSQIAFMDTETTGLSGGTGTVAFLVGVAWWEREGDAWVLRLEQFLMEDYCHEPEMLARLAERLRGFKVLCTYNGKTFDLPLLRTRAVMSRQSPRDFAHAQADLLHFSRRLWAKVLPSVSLRNVEREVLGIDRGEDIPGAEIPGVFFGLVQSGDAGRMAAVLAHNAQDLASLALLLGALSRVVRDPAGCGILQRAEEFAAMARWYESRRDFARAAAMWAEAICFAGDAAGRDALRHRLALAHKKGANWDAAVAIWEQLCRSPLAVALPAVCEIAKYREHVRRDTAEALSLARRWRSRLAMELELHALMGRPGAAPWQEHADDLERRCIRLEARLARKASP